VINVSTFLANIQKIVDALPSYKLGQDGSRGECDCIGLIIGAIRRAREKWLGTHGSNWTARNRMKTLQSPAPLELGGIVYKYHNPGDPGYNLPAVYKDHPDQRDYYHVGVITSVSPLRITHCTGGTTNGIKIDTKIGAWRYGGRLEGIDYESKEEEAPMTDPTGTAIVSAASGSSVRMRASASTKSIVRAYVPVGAQVDVLQKAGDWWEIHYDGQAGWMLASFLTGGDDGSTEQQDIISIPRSAAIMLLEALQTALGQKQ
jgi:uncharacterized protein YraI